MKQDLWSCWMDQVDEELLISYKIFTLNLPEYHYTMRMRLLGRCMGVRESMWGGVRINMASVK